jgi:hypothetical protein
MRHSSLSAFLNGEHPADELWREIEAEVRECLAACAKFGSGRVIITDGPETQLTREQVAVLLTALAEGDIPLEAASYIADAIIMSHTFEFEDEAVAEAVHFLADDSAPLTQGEVEEAQARLSTSS